MPWIQTVFTVTHRQAEDSGKYPHRLPRAGGPGPPTALSGLLSPILGREQERHSLGHAQSSSKPGPRPRVWNHPRNRFTPESHFSTLPGDPEGPSQTVCFEGGDTVPGGLQSLVGESHRLSPAGISSIHTSDTNHSVPLVPSSCEASADGEPAPSKGWRRLKD